MPYIEKYRREVVKHDQDRVSTVGELNFLFSTLAVEYVLKNGLSYSTINDVMGVFESAKLEFYRRVAAPYEDVKLAENGDVYEEIL